MEEILPVRHCRGAIRRGQDTQMPHHPRLRMAGVLPLRGGPDALHRGGRRIQGPHHPDWLSAPRDDGHGDHGGHGHQRRQSCPRDSTSSPRAPRTRKLEYWLTDPRHRQ